MEHCQDLNVRSSVKVKDAIRKPWDKGLPRGLSVNGKCLRKLTDSVDCVFKGRNKLLA